MQVARYQCIYIAPITEDISKIVLRPLEKGFTYQPGQYVEVQLKRGIWLPLSIANIPSIHHQLEFDLRHNHHHPLAQVLIEELKQFGEISVRGPFGKFTQAQVVGQQWLFLAGGTGIVPIKAILTNLLETPQPKPCHLFWGISHPQDAYEKDLLEEWKQRFAHFSYTLVLSNPKQYPTWKGPTGLVHQYLADQFANLADACVFACGPYEMIKVAKQQFLAQGLSESAYISDVS